MAKQEFSIPSLSLRVQTEADAYKLLEDLRWPTGQPDGCPHCGGMRKFYFLKPKDGTDGRATRTGSNSQRRVWKCSECRKQFSVLTGTVFHGTKVSIRVWLLVLFEMVSAKNSVSAWEVSRKFEVTPETAWHMLHRLREAMKREPVVSLLSGTVAADETRIGGKLGNQSNAKRRQRPQGWEAFNYKDNKPIVMSLVDTGTGEIRSRVIPDVTGATLGKAIRDQVDMGATTLVTDELVSYKQLRPELAGHETVVHRVKQYRNKRGYSTNRAEGYFGQLKRSIDGTHHKVSHEHLHRYLAQFDFLATYCDDTDSQRMRRVLGQVAGRRLTYKPLSGE